MLNKVTLIGRAGKEPETRYTSGGEAVTSFSLATTDKWTDKAGEKQEKTEWHNLTLFRRLAEVASEYVKKGDLLYVEGKIQTRKWQDKEGKDRYTTEIIVNEMQMLGGKKSEPGNSTTEPVASAPVQQPRASKTAPNAVGAESEDDIPF